MTVCTAAVVKLYIKIIQVIRTSTIYTVCICIHIAAYFHRTHNYRHQTCSQIRVAISYGKACSIFLRTIFLNLISKFLYLRTGACSPISSFIFGQPKYHLWGPQVLVPIAVNQVPTSGYSKFSHFWIWELTIQIWRLLSAAVHVIYSFSVLLWLLCFLFL